jgi:hypothetical protein
MNSSEDLIDAAGNEDRFRASRKENLAYESIVHSASYFCFAVAAQGVANAWLNDFASSFTNVLLAAAAISVWAGIGLRRLDPNARTAVAIISICSIAEDWQAIIFHGYFLHILFSSNASFLFSDPYRRAVRHTPDISPELRWLPVLVTVVFVFLTGINVIELAKY